ncbi:MULTISPECIES: hypothetical protein [Ralstonia]|mgnify:CR=1 FL=1|uniref:Uncharacterized protein n=4 Tax=Ralstonia TaxID=48736 RepID=A0AAW4QDN5_RALPI|nr:MULTISPECIES: hypothetical protein [Ralstonia]MEA3268210.1 hypothetical protein [Pseudomonadota bacterium]ANJ76602.1 hypothetical protein A9Y76_28750 [Ralstonia insidiosa]ENZ74848.1 hypothetical protein OR214_05179 [Ralstonia pickettii OR214]EPX94384.1 hypothetical protein C404_28945 [Ralstonia sp. AU12-08]KAB0467082.1 hypothetical protein F7R11_26465 [Ralstonia insidiosa]
MEQQKEPSLAPVLIVIGVLLVAAVLAALYYRSIEAQKARDRQIAASLARQKQAEEINRQEQAVIKKAPPLKLLRD